MAKGRSTSGHGKASAKSSKSSSSSSSKPKKVGISRVSGMRCSSTQLASSASFRQDVYCRGYRAASVGRWARPPPHATWLSSRMAFEHTRLGQLHTSGRERTRWEPERECDAVGTRLNVRRREFHRRRRGPGDLGTRRPSHQTRAHVHRRSRVSSSGAPQQPSGERAHNNYPCFRARRHATPRHALTSIATQRDVAGAEQLQRRRRRGAEGPAARGGHARQGGRAASRVPHPCRSSTSHIFAVPRVSRRRDALLQCAT